MPHIYIVSESLVLIAINTISNTALTHTGSHSGFHGTRGSQTPPGLHNMYGSQNTRWYTFWHWFTKHPLDYILPVVHDKVVGCINVMVHN